MSKCEFKQLVAIILFYILNVAIAYLITFSLGIENVVLLETYTATQNVITYEILIVFALSLIECLIYHNKYEMQ